MVWIPSVVCSCPSTPGEWMLVSADFFAMLSSPPAPLVHNGSLVGLALAPGWRHGLCATVLRHTREILAARGRTAPEPAVGVHSTFLGAPSWPRSAQSLSRSVPVLGLTQDHTGARGGCAG